MRYKILLTILLFSLLAPLWSTQAGLVFTYTTNQTLDLELTTQSIRYQLAIEKAKEGGYLLKAPPFLQADISQILHIGEIQPQGLFSRLLDPMDGNSATIGFIKGTNVSKNFIPSLNPKLSGFDLVGENIELIALSPLLNPSSPTGIGTILGTSKAYLALMTASQNNVLIQKSLTSYQVNWKELGYGQHMFFFLIGATNATSFGPIELESGAFLQGAFDTKLGGGNTTAVALEVKTSIANIKYERKLGGVGVKLKNLETKANPQVKTSLKFELGERLFGEHKTITYSKPIYGGNSQEHNTIYKVGFKTKYFVISSENSTDYEKDKGKVSYTTLTVKSSLKDKNFELFTQVYRPSTGSCQVHNTGFTVKDSHCNLEMKNKKIKLKLAWAIPISTAKLELSINQDRVLSAQLELLD